ncbi:MAG: energy transducer TonB [Saprospiraceae bacterium]
MNRYNIFLMGCFLLLLSGEIVAQSSEINLPFLLECEKMNADVRFTCSENKLFRYAQNKLKYPKAALDNGLEGVVVVSFIVTQKGKIISVKCEKDIGNGCGKEAIRIIETINDSKLKWEAGSKDGKKASFQVLNFPVFFDLTPVNHQLPKLEVIFFKKEITPIRIGKKKKKAIQELKSKDRLVPKIKEDTSLYLEVDRFPIFPGCQNGGPFKDALKAEDCSKMALNSYIYKVLEYPTRPFSEGVEGIVQVKYTIEKNGIISNIKITKGLHPACNQAVIDALESMNERNIRWKPAIKNGKPVRLEERMLIRFSITSEKERRAKNGY